MVRDAVGSKNPNTSFSRFFPVSRQSEGPCSWVTPHPNETWIVRVARNVTMEAWGFLSPGQYLIHHHAPKFCPAFQQIIDDAGVERIVLPLRSPNLNASRVRAFSLRLDHSGTGS